MISGITAMQGQRMGVAHAVLFRAFDFPQPDQSVERRPNTTVAQQALDLLNPDSDFNQRWLEFTGRTLELLDANDRVIATFSAKPATG